MAKAKVERPTADEWTDSVGQVFKPGDLVAIATVNGKSPQMVIARVEKINLTNAKGERLVQSVPTGSKVTRTRPEYIGPEMPKQPGHDTWSIGWRTERDERMREYWAECNRLRGDKANWRDVPYEVDEYHDVQAVTITATPLLDGRGFYRSGSGTRAWDKKTKPKAVTYMFPGNIVKLPASMTEAKLEAGKKRSVEWPPTVKRSDDY